jgi:hypothetical protein
MWSEEPMRKSPLLLSILGALSGCDPGEPFEDEGCMHVSASETSCPSRDSVDPDDLFIPFACGGDKEITEVTGEGTRTTLTRQDGTMREACCYPVKGVDTDPDSECIVGRPYFENGQARRAPILSEASTATVEESRRAAAWARAGAAEHASVAAFARLALELLAHGAPVPLLRDVHQAAIDELRHATVCWSLSEHFGGGAVSVGAFPFSAPVAVNGSLATLAASAVREGCLAETLGAHVADAAAELSDEPAVRSALRSIAAEEATHAVLSFRIVAWAMRQGGAEVRAAVRAALEAPWPRLDLAELSERSRVDVARLREAEKQGMARLLGPAVERLLAA